MTVLPVAQRELRVAARQPRTWWVRTLAAAAAVVVVAYASIYARILGAGTGGRPLFLGMAGFAAWICLVAGVTVTADAISRERREGTLGFLFLSHLGGFDVVLGKLCARATHAFYALLAVMPILALPFLDGGVTPGEFWWTMLALTNTLFFAVSLGLLVSSLCVEPRQASNTAVIAAVFFWLGLPALAGVANTLGWPAWTAAAALELTPLSAGTLAAAGVAPLSPARALAVSHLEAWLFLLAASLLTRRAWRERPAGRTISHWQEFRRNFTLGSPARRAARRVRLLDRGAFFWLVARHRWKPFLPLAFTVLLLALFALGWWLDGGASPPFALIVILAATLHLILKFWIAGEAAAAIATHRREGTLELLLSTPLKVEDIMRSQFRVLRWQFGLPLLFTAALTLSAPVILKVIEGTDFDGFGYAVTGAVLATLALAADAFTLVWLASWRAIVARRVHHAAGSAVFRVLVLPWLILLLLAPASRIGGGDSLIALWALVGFISDLCWWQWARSQLLENFRAAAERGYENSRPGFWARLTGR